MASYDNILKKFEVAINELDYKTPYDDSFTRPTRTHVLKVAKTLSHEVTKIALLLQELRANPEFFSNIEECIDVLKSMFKGFSAYAGESLYRAGKIHFLRVYKSIMDMIIDYKENEERLGEEEENIVSKERIGTAWKSCEMFEQLPLSNYHAIAQRSLDIYYTVNDAFEEVDEIYAAVESYLERCKEAESNGGGGGGDDGSENKKNEKDNEQEKMKKNKVQNDKDKDDDDDDDEEEEEEEEEFIVDDEDDDDFVVDDQDGEEEAQMMNRQEMKNVDDLHSAIEHVSELFHYFGEHLKSTYLGEDQDEVSKESKEKIDQLESVVSAFNEISTIVDDAASGMYPPQNDEFMIGQIAFLESKYEQLKQVFKKLSIEKPPTNHEEIIAQLQVVKLS